MEGTEAPSRRAANATVAQRATVDVIVIHETNGRKYLEALEQLHETGTIRSLKFVEASVLWKFLHSLIRERRSLNFASRQALRNLRFRLTFFGIRDAVIVLCIPPWDYRFLLFATLRRNNVFIYNSSWPYWEGAHVPRRWGILTPFLRRSWLRVLAESSVDIVAVTPAAAESLRSALPNKHISVISHAVTEAYFQNRAKFGAPFHILFAGDLVEQRGLLQLPEILNDLQNETVRLDIVGDGRLRQFAEQLSLNARVTYHGYVSDRRQLGRIMASCQILVAPSVRTDRWEELFGMSILEAMACGLPCIASDHVGPRTLITNGVDGILVPERSSAEVSKWIKVLLHDEQQWNKMSAAAVVTAASFKLSKVARLWENALGVLES